MEEVKGNRAISSYIQVYDNFLCFVYLLLVNIYCLLIVESEALFSCYVLHAQQNVMLHCRCASSETDSKLFLWAKSSSETLLHKIVSSVATDLKEE